MKQIHLFFRKIQKALWILNSDCQVLAKTKLAEEMEQSYLLNIKKIIDISLGQGCAMHSTQEECRNCPLGETVSAQGFPFKVYNKAGELLELWGRVDFEEEEMMLQISLEAGFLESRNEHSIFSYLNGVRENERKKIAQDLHDGIAQSVYSLMLETRGIKWTEQVAQEQKLRTVDQHFSEVLMEIKELAGRLRPMSIDEFGLIPALEQFVKQTLEMTGFEIELVVVGCEYSLTEAVRVAAYRIIQEAVNNAMKYSGENQVRMTLDYQGATLQVAIEDKGLGFNLAKEGQGFGLLNMAERARDVGGTLTIQSQLGEGSRVFFSLPVKEGCK